VLRSELRERRTLGIGLGQNLLLWRNDPGQTLKAAPSHDLVQRRAVHVKLPSPFPNVATMAVRFTELSDFRWCEPPGLTGNHSLHDGPLPC